MDLCCLEIRSDAFFLPITKARGLGPLGSTLLRWQSFGHGGFVSSLSLSKGSLGSISKWTNNHHPHIANSGFLDHRFGLTQAKRGEIDVYSARPAFRIRQNRID